MATTDTVRRDGQVAVIIAARDAEATIGAAVRSALSQRETAEVLVVDDASTDGTGRAAMGAAEGDPRLHVLTCPRNIGPAAARNVAIAASTAPVVALLDADDLFLPGRLGRLLSLPDWDLVADNIAFVTPGADVAPLGVPATPDAGLSALDLADFVRGNLPRPGAPRGELGFLKPLIRRAFLDKAGLRYDARLRLGEDYDLYVRALMAGARFFVSHRVGYLAHVRQTSLSARHGTADLARLAETARAHLSALPRDHAARPAMARLHQSLRARHLHRACLEEKARGGIVAALGLALRPPSNALPIAQGVLRDKLAPFRRAATASDQPRLLIRPLPDTGAAAKAASPSRA